MKKSISFLISIALPLSVLAWSVSDEYEIGVSGIISGHYPGYTTPLICDGTNITDATIPSTAFDMTVLPYFETNAFNNVTNGTVTSLPPGSAATVTMTQSAGKLFMNLGIPQGATGSSGAAGATGATGSVGATGATGPTITSSVLYTNIPLNTVLSNGTGFMMGIGSSYTVTPALILGNAFQRLYIAPNSTPSLFVGVAGNGQPSSTLALFPASPCSWYWVVPKTWCFYISNSVTGVGNSISTASNIVHYVP